MTALEGRVVAITRDGDDDDPLAHGLRREGAEVRHWPTLAFLTPEDPKELDRALERLGDFDWLVVTSARAVEPLAVRMEGTPASLVPPVAAVGPATAAAARSAGWSVAVTGDGGAHALARAMAEDHDLRDARILFPAGSRARDTLHRQLAARRARVTRVTAYRTALRPPDGARIRRDLAAGLDAVTFASPSAVEALDRALEGDLARVLHPRPAVAIGPTTAAALADRGVRPVAVAAETSLKGLVGAVVDVLAPPPAPSSAPRRP